MTDADIAQIVEGIEEFIVAGDPRLADIWQPYIDKLWAVAALDLPQMLTDAVEIRSACGFMWMRMAVVKDVEDAYAVAKREFTDHEAAFKRLETSLVVALGLLVEPS